MGIIYGMTSAPGAAKPTWGPMEEPENVVNTINPERPNGQIVQGNTISERVSPPGAKHAVWQTIESKGE